ncbi:RibD family protein [Hydrogenophaga sp.]|uniref:RibD family protein n=1 Tax=Hydrogenophaga sp. TaxID=1904254 RepID=UPI002718CF20|nr:RibD family protein [Hydrogenophaga sp.]MDO9438891.1 RibD family protein [Hydrogenophaga sp.]
MTPPRPQDAPSCAAPPGITDLPSDWSSLWLQMLQAASSSHATPLLTHSADSGWALGGICSARSAALFDLYKPLLDARTAPLAAPWVVAQLGQSLDGFVATATGDSYYVNGAHCLLHLHRLRALCDAVIVGAGTVAIDNPQLTTRRVPGPQPMRVVLDPAARLDGQSRVFRDGQAPSLWVCDARHAHQARLRLGDLKAPHTTEVLAVDGLLDATGASRPERAVAALGQRGLRLLFVEGGGMTVSRFFKAGALDRLHLVVAPVLIGNGRRGLQVPAHDVMADCPRPRARTLALGEDMLWDLALRSHGPQ